MEAEDSSATAATSTVAETIVPISAETSSTFSPIRWNASRARSTTSTPSAVRRAPSSTTPTVFCVSDWISWMSRAIWVAACWDSSASLRTSSATTAKPRPCSPARAASIAGVQGEQVRLRGDAGDRLDDAADLLRLRGEPADRAGDRLGRLAHGLHRLRGLLRGGDALLGDLAGLVGGPAYARTGSEEPALARDGNRLEARVAVEADEDRPDVVSHRRRRDGEPRGDLPRPDSRREKPQDLGLPRRQRLLRRLDPGRPRARVERLDHVEEGILAPTGGSERREPRRPPRPRRGHPDSYALDLAPRGEGLGDRALRAAEGAAVLVGRADDLPVPPALDLVRAKAGEPLECLVPRDDAQVGAKRDQRVPALEAGRPRLLSRRLLHGHRQRDSPPSRPHRESPRSALRHCRTPAPAPGRRRPRYRLAMCFELDSLPPIPVISGASVSHRDLVLEARDGNRLAAFAAMPDEPNGSGVVVLPDVRGLYRFYEELALRFAERGFAAVAFDYFGRTAGVAKRGDEFPYMEHVQQTTPEGVQADVGAAVAHLRSAEGGACRSVFTVGFCYGGRHSWLAAAGGHGLAGAVGFYGMPGERNGQPGPTQRAAELAAPILALQAGDDQHITPADNAAFDAALAAAGVEHELVVYDGSPHSFFDRRYEEHADASADAWNRVVAFLERHA